jgi:hypothetical protein
MMKSKSSVCIVTQSAQESMQFSLAQNKLKKQNKHSAVLEETDPVELEPGSTTSVHLL